MTGQFTFGGIKLNIRTGELSGRGIAAKLTPRATAVLAALAERAEELVSKQELIDRVWGGKAISDDALTSCIQELRGALGDHARHPRFIETRHRRGYRLMVPARGPGKETSEATTSVPPLVGRAAELAFLEERFRNAQKSERQLVFVTGEPGIGKSALVKTFLDTLGEPAPRIARGQCLDHHGVSEPYRPLIEAFSRLGAAHEGVGVKQVLAAHAPTWFAQMPSLWSENERRAFAASVRPTRERMLRELTQGVEILTADRPVVLVLEDVHWSDASTLDWLVHMARHTEPARLMVLATFRPMDPAAVPVGLDGLTAELSMHGRCSILALGPLDLTAVESYVAAHLIPRADAVARQLLQRTSGNPLFLVSLVRQLSKQSDAASEILTSIPQDVRRFIERQIDAISAADRDLLAAASVIGREFATPAVAAALETDLESVEASCARLARHDLFIGRIGLTTWPDGTLAEIYSFRHDLHRELFYDRLSATRRALCHVRAGRRLEGGWSGQVEQIAAELAEHFDRGREPARAIAHHQRAASKALRRSANQAAIRHLQRAIQGLPDILDENERIKAEVELRIGIGSAHIALRGFGAPEVLDAYATAERLCEHLGERIDLFPAVWGQWMFRTGRGETAIARRLAAQLLAMADRFDDYGLKLQAHHAMWSTSFVCGELMEARAHAEAGLAAFDPCIHQAMASSFGNHDAGCCARNFAAVATALMGDDSSARRFITESVAAARALGDPFSLSLTLYFTSAAAQMTGDLVLARTNAEESLRIATEHELAQPKAWSSGVAGWCAVLSGDTTRGLLLLDQAVETMETAHSRHFLPYLIGLRADALLTVSRVDAAMLATQDGLDLAENTGEQFYSAELQRLRGEILMRLSRKSDAIAAFEEALRIAKTQGAGALIRRVSESLAAAT